MDQTVPLESFNTLPMKDSDNPFTKQKNQVEEDENDMKDLLQRGKSVLVRLAERRATIITTRTIGRRYDFFILFLHIIKCRRHHQSDSVKLVYFTCARIVVNSDNIRLWILTS